MYIQIVRVTCAKYEKNKLYSDDFESEFAFLLGFTKGFTKLILLRR